MTKGTYTGRVAMLVVLSKSANLSSLAKSKRDDRKLKSLQMKRIQHLKALKQF